MIKLPRDCDKSAWTGYSGAGQASADGQEKQPRPIGHGGQRGGLRSFSGRPQYVASYTVTRYGQEYVP